MYERETVEQTIQRLWPVFLQFSKPKTAELWDELDDEAKSAFNRKYLSMNFRTIGQWRESFSEIEVEDPAVREGLEHAFNCGKFIRYPWSNIQ
jgi:hypothetical protein